MLAVRKRPGPSQGTKCHVAVTDSIVRDLIVRDLFIIQGRPTDSDTSHELEEIQSEQTNVQIDIVINNIR